MTLLVAGGDGSCVWMVADTAVSSSQGDTRPIGEQMKIVPAHRTSLIGFSGNVVKAKAALIEAIAATPGPDALDVLLAAHRDHQDTDFAYAYLDDGRPRLWKVAAGEAIESQTFHLGQHDAFAQLQRLRNEDVADHPPDAIYTFIFAVPEMEAEPPDGFSRTVFSMQRLLFQRAERDIGGLVTPYLLDRHGVRLGTYGFSASDPIVSQLSYGQTIPHGTAPAGGFGVSVTELQGDDGIVVYWPQKPGGRISLGDALDPTVFEFDGTPSEFKVNVRAALGIDVDIWFSDQPQATPEVIEIVPDREGRPRFAVARSEKVLSFAWASESPEPFISERTILMTANNGIADGVGKRPNRLDVALAQDKASISVQMFVSNESRGSIVIDAAHLDEMLGQLGKLRASMAEAVPREIQPGQPLMMCTDPIWRTNLSPHATIRGVLLFLRHVGFGWLPFLLPPNEAVSIGKWLVENGTTPPA